MAYRILADATIILHLAFVLFGPRGRARRALATGRLGVAVSSLMSIIWRITVAVSCQSFGA